MQTIELIVGAACASILTTAGLFGLRDYLHNKSCVERNWIVARCKREEWFEKMSLTESIPSIRDATGEAHREIARTPIGQWYIRAEAGAYQLWLLEKFWVSKKDKDLLQWYFEMTYSDIFAQDPIEE